MQQLSLCSNLLKITHNMVHNHGIDPSCPERVVDGALKGECLVDLERWLDEQEQERLEWQRVEEDLVVGIQAENEE